MEGIQKPYNKVYREKSYGKEYKERKPRPTSVNMSAKSGV
jgi:hypothetical protein